MSWFSRPTPEPPLFLQHSLKLRLLPKVARVEAVERLFDEKQNGKVFFLLTGKVSGFSATPHTAQTELLVFKRNV